MFEKVARYFSFLQAKKYMGVYPWNLLYLGMASSKEEWDKGWEQATHAYRSPSQRRIGPTCRSCSKIDGSFFANWNIYRIKIFFLLCKIYPFVQSKFALLIFFVFLTI